MSRQITGKATIHVDGVQLRMAKGARLNVGGVSRSPERHGGTTYFAEEEQPPTLTGELLHDKDADLIADGDIRNATVIFEADTGQQYIMRGAYSQNPLELDSGNGRSELTLFGNSCDKV